MRAAGRRATSALAAVAFVASALCPPSAGSVLGIALARGAGGRHFSSTAAHATASTASGMETDTAAPTESVEPAQPLLTLEAPAVCSARTSIIATATLTDASGTPLPNRTIIFERVGSVVATLAVRVTDEAGRARATVRPTARLDVRARYDGAEGFAAVLSDVASVMPKVAVSRPWTHDSFAYPGQRVPARGTLWPRHSKSSTSTVVVCERYENGTWVARARYRARITNTATYSRYTAVVRFPLSGLWRVRARHQDHRHALTYGSGQKVRVTNWPRRYAGKRMGGFRTSRRAVAITIDDGPNGRTPEICEILKRFGARGTFFFTSQLLARGYQDQAKRTYDRGHEIANHTASHKMLIGAYSTSYFQAITPKRAIRRCTGFSPIWIRAMGGGIDSTGMRAVVDSGQLYCNWSIDSYDSHRSYTPPSVLYHNVMRSVRPGSVILIHQTHPETIRALPAICRELKRRGYRMVTLSELAAYGTAR